MKKLGLYLIGMVILVLSCKENAPEHADEHAESVKIRITAYNDDFELFAEAVPLVVGETGNILSHFSYLSNFKPLEKGSVTIKLIVNQKEITQTLQQPSRKGIYSFDLKPVATGTGKLVFLIQNEDQVSTIEISSVTVYADEEAAHEAALKESASKANTAGFTKEQSWKIDFATGFPSEEAFGQVIKTVAQIESATEDEVLISAKTSGIVHFSRNDILAGQTTAAGQGLCILSSAEMADNNLDIRFQEAKNEYEKAKAELERKLQLAKDKIVSEKELQSAQKEFADGKSRYDLYNGSFKSGKQTVTSPISGFIKSVHVRNGQFVREGDALFSVSKNKTLVLHADVQQKFASLLPGMVSANIRIPNDEKVYTLEELHGKFISSGRAATEESYLIPVNIQIDNTGNFLPGGFVDLFIKTRSSDKAVIIPNEALMEDQGNYYVFVQLYPELFEKREVRPGSTDGVKTMIISGLEAQERIILKGAMFVKLAQATGALDAHSGHTH